MFRVISFVSGSRKWLAAAAMLLICQGAAQAQSAALSGTEPTILVTDIHSAATKYKNEPSIDERTEMRAAVAAQLRKRFGAVITPPLSIEEKQCDTVPCAVQITRRYLADYLLWAGVSASKSAGGQGQCALNLIIVPAQRGDGEALPKAILHSVPLVACTQESLTHQLTLASAEVFTKELGLAQRTPPPCRYHYANSRRGIATGIGLGLAVAGGGLGFGSLAEQSRGYSVTGSSEHQANFGGLSGGVGTGFAAMTAGLALTGSALMPWERIIGGPNPTDCQEPPSVKYGMRRSALVSFFATSLLASLLSTFYFAAPHDDLKTKLPDGVTASPTSLKPGYLVGSGVFAGGYAVGLALSIFLP